MHRLFLIGLSLSFAVPVYASPVDISGGVEQFVWQEYDDAGDKLVKESGQRKFVSVAVDNEVSDRWIYGFRGRIYSGTVDYDGQLMNGTSYSTDTNYDGVLIDVDFTGRFMGSDGQYSDLGLRFGVDGEAWRRRITGAGGYTEEYAVVSGNLGLAYIPGQGLFGEVGAKYPFSINEDVDLYDDVTLKPKGAFSLFATVGYNFNQRWSVKGHYDSYRFKASDTEPLTDGGVLVGNVYQPESSMDLYGISIGFYF